MNSVEILVQAVVHVASPVVSLTCTFGTIINCLKFKVESLKLTATNFKH